MKRIQDDRVWNPDYTHIVEANYQTQLSSIWSIILVEDLKDDGQ
jgi:hypothetical protein